MALWRQGWVSGDHQPPTSPIPFCNIFPIGAFTLATLALFQFLVLTILYPPKGFCTYCFFSLECSSSTPFAKFNFKNLNEGSGKLFLSSLTRLNLYIIYFHGTGYIPGLSSSPLHFAFIQMIM